MLPVSTVLITGASSGIGAELARAHARRGDAVVLLARRADRLQELAKEISEQGGKAWVFAADVTREGDVAAAIASLANERVGIDRVYANAGFGVAGAIQRIELADYRRQFETNVFGLLSTIYESLPALRLSRGQLVLIGSVAGHVSAPGASAYSASKFAVRALAESLRR
ncbi:MAG: SDR family NAD(P)-dependent oxidoreductase [Gammaproteobacteria bacterium]|nr:SDR family NAD(P)-dependent oxidoreductase [Gammaproteobacteria bacterium]